MATSLHRERAGSAGPLVGAGQGLIIQGNPCRVYFRLFDSAHFPTQHVVSTIHNRHYKLCYG